MRLNQSSDFALRILMLLANEDEPITVDVIAKRLNLVKSHVMKIVAKLVSAGLLSSQRGRAGGIRLGREPEHITVGEVIREMESNFAVVECMQDGVSSCVFTPRCKLRNVMADARAAFLSVLDDQTLQAITRSDLPLANTDEHLFTTVDVMTAKPN